MNDLEKMEILFNEFNIKFKLLTEDIDGKGKKHLLVTTSHLGYTTYFQFSLNEHKFISWDTEE